MRPARSVGSVPTGDPAAAPPAVNRASTCGTSAKLSMSSIVDPGAPLRSARSSRIAGPSHQSVSWNGSTAMPSIAITVPLPCLRPISAMRVASILSRRTRIMASAGTAMVGLIAPLTVRSGPKLPLPLAP